MIWWNSHLCIEGKPFFWVDPYRRGLKYIAQLFNQGKVIDYEQLKTRFNLTYLQYRGLLSTIPKKWLNDLKDENFQDVGICSYDIMSTCDKMASKVYEQLTSSPDILEVKKCKWEK